MKAAGAETGEVIVGACRVAAGERNYSLHLPRPGPYEQSR